MADFFPRQYAKFGGWYNQLTDGCAAHKAAVPLTDQEVGDMQAAGEDWGTGYAAYLAAQTALDAAQATMLGSLNVCIAWARKVNGKVQANEALSADFKTELGLPVYDVTPTRAAAPETAPVALVDTSERLRHKLKWRDESTPLSRAKPKGVTEAEIWSKVGGTAPADASECEFAAGSSKSSLVLNYAGADAGKPVYYLLRWKTAHNEFGPWSETVIATIGA